MSHSKDSQTLEFEEARGDAARKFQFQYGRSIRISRVDYKIVPCETIHLNGQECLGVCDPEIGTLYVNIKVGSPAETLLHEIVHGELSECGIKQHPKWCTELEEIVAEVLSKAIASQFKLKKIGLRAGR